MKDRKNKPVSFNLISEHESRLLAYAEDKKRGNFSQYVKRLISEDMNKKTVYSPTPVVSEPANDDADAMGGFL